MVADDKMICVCTCHHSAYCLWIAFSARKQITNKFYKRSIFVDLKRMDKRIRWHGQEQGLRLLPHSLCYLNLFVVCADKSDWWQVMWDEAEDETLKRDDDDGQQNKPCDNGEYFLMFRLIPNHTNRTDRGSRYRYSWINKASASSWLWWHGW